MIPYSEDFSQWSKLNSTVTSNLIISPDGTQNSDLINYNISSSNGYIRLSHSASQYVSFYVKYKDIQWLMVYGSGLGAGKFVDIKNSVVGGNVGSGANIQIINAGNDWKRIIFYSSSANITQTSIYAAASDNSYATITLTGGVYLWGAQAESLSYATSYIPTNGAAVTRAAETLNNAANSDLINSTEGVLYAEIAALSNDGTNKQISLNNGTTDDRIQLYYSTSSNQISVFYKSQSGATAFILNHTLSDITQFNKVAFKWKQNDFALWSNGVEVATQTSGVTSSAGTLTKLDFKQFNGFADFFGKTKCVAVFKEALSDTELACLTSTNNREIFLNYYYRMQYVGANTDALSCAEQTFNI